MWNIASGIKGQSMFPEEENIKAVARQKNKVHP